MGRSGVQRRFFSFFFAICEGAFFSQVKSTNLAAPEDIRENYYRNA